MISERRTQDERYAQAMHSSDLAPLADRRVDVDYLIAAGLIKEGLGAKLYRLASEWDLAAGDWKLARRHLRQVESQALQIRRNAAKHPKEAEVLLAEADRLMQQASNEATTAKALALVHLKSLRSAREGLGEFACWHATRTRFMEPDTVVVKLAGQALNLWLDGVCNVCHGTMRTGLFSGPRPLCGACGATGRAHYSLNRGEPHQAFVRALLLQMDMRVERVDRQMRRYLRQGG